MSQARSIPQDPKHEHISKESQIYVGKHEPGGNPTREREEKIDARFKLQILSRKNVLED